ncbi:ATPase family AAA domain-containing protein 5b isoform X2 [Chaetodon trifascialis]|uniref:ATPase family AAA domain-containing protein 5b isoform X2 n=1 Tax=Chaetodon trifascialis TaxID=109706 RepID=UPI0039918BB9
MRNKLKRTKKSEDASFSSKDRPRASAELSGWSCSSEHTDSASVTTAVPAAAISAREDKPLQERIKDIKIAPIFLRTAQHSKSKRSSDVKLQTALVPAHSEDVQHTKSQRRTASVSHPTQRCRGQLSPSALHSCLQEIQTSNPEFPVRAVFSILQRKTSLQDLGSTENSLNLQNHLNEKRKRVNEGSDRVPKRLRSSVITDGANAMGHCHMSVQGVQESAVLAAGKQPGGNKLSRTHRLRQQSGNPAGPVSSCELDSGVTDHTLSHSQSVETSDSRFEDVLWTDKYSPQHSSEVMGNCGSVNKLQSWLKKWKRRADCDERRKMEERKREDSGSGSWDCGDFQGEAGPEDDGGEPLCNTMLITGPPGVGKTASVYACSQELGFKVFEVNCSSQRSGHHVLSQLKEATQSHLVEMSGKDPLKPTYFNNYSSATKPETLPGKTVPLKNVTSTSKMRAAQNFGCSRRKGKANPASVTLANYFKMKAKADHLHSGGLLPSAKPDSKTSCSPSPGCDKSEPQNKKTATSLILFEEVDVIFDDDVGFLAAIKAFMTTTKRPIVLTTNDPSFRERFNRSLEEIIFKTPSAVNVCSYLQLVALAENVRLELDDVSSLLRLSRGDVRHCLLQLQLWVRSGGGRASQSGGLSKGPSGKQDSSVTQRGDNVDGQRPDCDSGCTASMLGLHPVTQNQLLTLLKCQVWSEIDMIKLLTLLAESWRGGVPLLYSNLELFLPIWTGGMSVHCPDKGPRSGLHSELAPADLDGNVSPKASVADRKSVRNISRLSRRKHITTSSSSLTQTPQRTSLSLNRADSRAPSWRYKTEQNAAKVATNCLDALTDFFDLMSYLDATMPAAAPLVSGSCRPDAFVWTGAEVKDGMLDEMSEEEGRRWSQESLLDIQAAVEGLGCHRCLWRVSEAWTEAGQEVGLTSPASSRRQSLSFSFQSLCAPSVSKRRYELSRTVLGSTSVSLLGNRRAVAVDYMPFLRHICRFKREQRHKEEPARCVKHLRSIQLGLSKSALQLLTEDFS